MIEIRITQLNQFIIKHGDDVLFVSREYKQNASCIKAINSLKANIKKNSKCTLRDNRMTIKGNNNKTVVMTEPHKDCYAIFLKLRNFIGSKEGFYIDSKGDKVKFDAK